MALPAERLPPPRWAVICACSPVGGDCTPKMGSVLMACCCESPPMAGKWQVRSPAARNRRTGSALEVRCWQPCPSGVGNGGSGTVEFRPFRRHPLYSALVLGRDRCNRRILCGVISWRRRLPRIHRNDTGCEDGEITRCGEGAVLAGSDSATGSQWTGNEAVLCPGRDSRTPVLLVAANLASAR